MKKQNLLLLFLFLSFTGAQAQDLLSFTNVSNKETTSLEKTPTLTLDDDMKTVLEQEVQRFRTFITDEFEYPELSKNHGVEGQMIVRIVFDGQFEKARVIKSVDPLLDEMVLDKISKYIANFDRNYENAPRMVFRIPINFRLEG